MKRPSPFYRWNLGSNALQALLAAALLLFSTTAFAQLTWDANTGTLGIQVGDGTWNTSTANWHNGTSNVAWNNTNNANTTAVFGLNTATAGGTITLSGTINLGGMRFTPFASTPTFAHTFTGGTLAFADNAIIEMAELTSTGSGTVQFVNLNSVVTGNNLTIQRVVGAATTFQYLRFGGINPNLTGTLTLKSNSSGVGIFALVATAAANAGLSRVVVESGSTYAISGPGNTYAVPMTIAGTGSNSGAIRLDSNDQIISGAITLSATSLIHSNTSTLRTTLSSAIGETGGAQGFQRSAILSASTVSYTGTSNFSGTTTFGRATANGGVNTFDFSAVGAPASNIFYNGAGGVGGLTMIGGNSGATALNLIGNAGSNNSQRFGGLSLTVNSATLGGLSLINLTSGAGGKMDLTLGAITRSAQAALAITGPASGDVSTSNANGFLGPWATYRTFGGMAGWAQTVSGKVTGGYVGALAYVSSTALSELPGYATSTNLAITGGSSGNITVTGATTNLNTLTMNDAFSDRTVAQSASTLRLGTIGGVQLAQNARNLTIGQAGAAGTLSAGGTVINTPGELIVTNNTTMSTIRINSVIANNGNSTGAVALLFNGAAGSKTILTGSNSYTGGTTLYSGAVEVQHALALGSSGTATVQEGAALQLSGNITLARALSVGGTGVAAEGVIRNLSGTNTIGGAVALLAPTRINSDAGSLTFFLTNAATSIFTGTQALTFGGAGDIVINSRIANGTGTLTKDGTGTLTLGGSNTYTGATTVNAGTLRFATGQVMTTSGVAIGAGGTADLNGQTTDRAFSISGTGVGSGGAIINSSGTTGMITGTVALTAASNIGGSGNIIINNATGLTGNFLLAKFGNGTLTVIDSTTTSARTAAGVNQIDAGMLRLQSPLAIAPVGIGAYALNGGTLSLGFDVTNAANTGAVNMLSSSTIIADRASLGAGGIIHTLGALTIGGSTLTVQAGANVSSGTVGLTLGTTTIGGAQLLPGNPTFDVQSTTTAPLTLTLGGLSDQAIAPRTITFQNSGPVASTITLGTLATSLVDGTVVNINNGTNAGVTVNMNVVGALGGLSQVNVNGNSTLTTGITNVVLGSLGGSGTVNTSGTFTLVVGNASNATLLNSNFSGVLSNGTGTLALTKAGLGTLTLSGSTSNTHTGLTTVTAGTLVLAKSGGTALGGALTIGSTAASTTGNATVRLQGDGQMTVLTTDTNNLTVNAGGTLDMNGHTLTVNTLVSFFGSTVTGLGTLVINRTGGTIGFAGVNTIDSTLQITTANSGNATRTVSLVNATDQVTFGGSVTQAVGFTGTITKTGSGTLILSGDNSYTGITTVSAGMINIRHGNALGTTTGNTVVSSGGTLQIQGGITTAAEPLVPIGSGFAGVNGIGYQTGAVVNVSGTNNYAGLLTLSISPATLSSDSGTLNFTNVGTIAGANSLILAGAGDGSISSIIGAAVTGLTKNGAGTWTLKGVNASTGPITINAGILKLGDGTTGRYSSTPSLIYSGTGTFEYAGSTAATTQALGALTLTSGAGTLQINAPSSGINALTFSSLAAPAVGSGLNFVSPANTSVTLTGATNLNGIVNARLTYDGIDFASSTSGVIGAAATATATSSLTAGNLSPYLINGSFAQTDSVIVNAGLKFAGSNTLTINNGILLTINNGANTAGGLLITGGSAAVIANEGSATGLTTAGIGDLVVRTNAPGDSLNIQAPITSTTTGGVTKNGAGTLTLSAANAYTGVTHINEGALILGNAAAISNSAAIVRVGGVLNLNGQTLTNAATLNGTGIASAGALINDSGMASIGALTLGAGFGTGAISASIGGSGSIQSTGALVGDGILVKTGLGTLILGNNGLTAVPSTRTGATRIDQGIMRISNSTTAIGGATAQLILNGGTLSIGSSTSIAAYPTAVTDSSSIVSDVFTAGAGLTHTLGVLAIGSHTLTVSAGSNVTTASTNAGITFGITTLLGSPTFDIQSPTTAASGTTTLTLGVLNDRGVAQTINFVNTGAANTNGFVTLSTAMGSLIDGTVVNLNGGMNAGVTLNLNLAAALGTLAQVTVNGNSNLNIGAAQTIASLSGNGAVTGGAFALTIGNASSGTVQSTNFTGTLSNGSGALAITKSGLGTLTLSGANAYTGATSVSLGVLRLNNANALGSTSGVTIGAGGTVDLNGQITDRNFSSISGTGHSGGGALINSSSTTATITGTSVLGAASKIGGTGNITVSNAGGLTGSVLLTKFGAGTLTFISSTTSARTGVNQIDAGTLRVQAATAIAPIGTGAYAMNGGTLNLGFDVTNLMTNVVNVLSSSTIIADRSSAGAGGIVHTLGALGIGGSTLTVQAGANVSSSTVGLTLGAVTIGGVQLLPGNPTFDVQSTANAPLTLTLGALTDQAIAPRTITFQNSGTAASAVTLGTAATSLVDGTVVNLANTGGPVTLNLNITNTLGTFAQVTVASGNTLSLAAGQTFSALNGSGTVSPSTPAVMTIGNILSPTISNSVFNGVLAGGANLSMVKTGTGSMTLSGAASNTYSGSAGTVVTGGTLILAKTGGATAISTNLTIDATGTAAGTAAVRLEGSDQILTTAALTLNTGATFELNGFNQSLGNLNGTDGGTIQNNASSTNVTLTIGTGNATGGVYLGRITDNSSGTGTVAVTKLGSGVAAFGGSSSYSGTTTVQAGSLQVGIGGIGQSGTGATTISNGATVYGTGVIRGSSFTAASGSTVQAGDGIAQANYGTLQFTPASGAGAIDFQSGSSLILGINPGGASDLLNFVGTGTNTLLFNGNLTITASAFTPVAEETFNLLDWSGLTSSPTFASRYSNTGRLFGNGDEATGLDLPDISTSDYYWDMSNFTTNGTIAVMLVPEPSRAACLLIAGLAVFLRSSRYRS
jgi:fibronectin-binding autotransporter adhesin